MKKNAKGVEIQNQVFHLLCLAGSYGCATGEPRQDRKVATVVMILLAVGNLAFLS